MRTFCLTIVVAAGVAPALPAPGLADDARTPEQRTLDAAGRSGFRQAAEQMQPPPAALTVTAEAVGCHWRFTYAAPAVAARFDPAATPCADRLCTLGLDPDRAAPIPAATRVRLVATTADKLRVIAVPTLGLQVEAVPGKTDEAWLEVKQPGIYNARQGADCVGEELAIPAAFRALDRRAFDEWLARHRTTE